jgi:filamentous hemagglutinin family protein
MKALRRHFFMVLAYLFSGILLCHLESFAQTPITSLGLNTQVSEPNVVGGQTQFNITGGTRPGNGTNLFHSFGTFNVPNANIANFLNETGLPTSNILGRVNGGNVSNIFGTIQTTGFGNANLFLINPTGFLFGPNATLNVGGMVAFTSADYIRLADNARFNAVGGPADALLTAAPVAAFGFLGSNPGAITVQGSQLTVTENTGISLVGGNITVEGATLTARSGQINLVSVGRPSKPNVGGEVVIARSGQEAGFTPTGFRDMGNITVSQGSTLDVSAQAGGSVVIRGGQLVIDDAQIFANGSGEPGGSVIMRGEDISLNKGTIYVFNDFARAGVLDLQAGYSINVTDTFVLAGTLVSSGATITLSAPFVSLNGSLLIGGNPSGGSGLISISGTNVVSLNDTGLDAGTGGTILINGGAVFTSQRSGLSSGGEFGGGTIQVKADKILLTDTSLSTSVRGRLFDIRPVAGTITLDANNLALNNSQILSTGQDGHGGIIHVSANKMVLTDSILSTSVTSDANAHLIGGTITIDGKNTTLTNSQILSTATHTPDTAGESNGGTITITSPRFHQDANSVIDASSQFGTNGTVTINGVVQP